MKRSVSLYSIDHWCPYLLHSEFIIRTDPRSLVHLDDQRPTTPWQHKALTKLLGLDYKIVYKQGRENRVADALSRTNHGDRHELEAVTVTVSPWVQTLQDSYSQDPDTQKLLQEFSMSSPSDHYSLVKGLIYFKGRIWVGNAR